MASGQLWLLSVMVSTCTTRNCDVSNLEIMLYTWFKVRRLVWTNALESIHIDAKK